MLSVLHLYNRLIQSIYTLYHKTRSISKTYLIYVDPQSGPGPVLSNPSPERILAVSACSKSYTIIIQSISQFPIGSTAWRCRLFASFSYAGVLVMIVISCSRALANSRHRCTQRYSILFRGGPDLYRAVFSLARVIWVALKLTVLSQVPRYSRIPKSVILTFSSSGIPIIAHAYLRHYHQRY